MGEIRCRELTVETVAPGGPGRDDYRWEIRAVVDGTDPDGDVLVHVSAWEHEEGGDRQRPAQSLELLEVPAHVWDAMVALVSEGRGRLS